MSTTVRGIKKPVFGKVLSVLRHPNAQKLYIAIVDVARENYVQVIFGGTTVLCAGDIVAVALPGTWLPGGEKIRARNYRGMRSYAEILSRDELFGTQGGPDEVLLLSQYADRIGQSVNLSVDLFVTPQEAISKADQIRPPHYRKVHRS